MAARRTLKGINLRKECIPVNFVMDLDRPNRCSVRIFTTMDKTFYLFCMLDPYGCDHGIHIPIQRKDLKKEVLDLIENRKP